MPRKEPKESSVAAIKALLSAPTAAASATTPLATEPAAAAVPLRHPKQSSIEAIKRMQMTAAPTRPPPAPQYVARAKAADKQSTIEAVKLRGRPQLQAPPAPAAGAGAQAGSQPPPAAGTGTGRPRAPAPTELEDDLAQLGDPQLGLARARPARKCVAALLSYRLRIYRMLCVGRLPYHGDGLLGQGHTHTHTARVMRGRGSRPLPVHAPRGDVKYMYEYMRGLICTDCTPAGL